MWILTAPAKEGDTPLVLSLPFGTKASPYTVGRKEGDIIIANDKSLSKKHAELILSPADGGSLSVKDLNSKFGVIIKDASGERRVGEHAERVANGASLKLGSTMFTVERQPLVVCTSGVKGPEKIALKAVCEQLGATLVNDWRDDVTHLVMPQCTWTPKLLFALATLKAVISPAWLQAAAARAEASAPLPDVGASEFAPLPAATHPGQAGMAAGVTTIQRVRATLFRGLRFICLPAAAPAGGGPAEPMTSTTEWLLERMGATARGWEASSMGSDGLAALIADGWQFILPGDETSASTQEAKAVAAAGGALFSPLSVRTSLIQAKKLLQPVKLPPAARSKAAPQAKPASSSGASAAPAAPPASSSASASDPPASRKRAAPADVPGGLEADAATQPAAAAEPTPAANGGAAAAPQKRSRGGSRASVPAPASPAPPAPAPEPRPAAAPPPNAADAAAASLAAPDMPLRPVDMPPPLAGWRWRGRLQAAAHQDGGGGGAAAAADGTAPAPAADTPQEADGPPRTAPAPRFPVATNQGGFVGKRFRKVGPTRGPGALVRVRMEPIVNGRDAEGAPMAEEAAPAENAHELFEEAVQGGGRGGGRRRR